MGPSFVHSFLHTLMKGTEQTPSLEFIDSKIRAQMIRAVGISIVCKKALHPNLEICLRMLRSILMDKVNCPGALRSIHC
jgi:hypothetical protein